jgi:transposase
MGQRSAILARILGFDGWCVSEHFFEGKQGERVEAVGSFRMFRGTLLVLRVAPRWLPRCSQCGEVCAVVHENGKPKRRRWRELPWGDHHVVIEYAPRRVKCRRCDAHCVEMVAWADPRQRTTRRLQQRIALDCAAAPLSHVAERYGISWSTVRRAEEQAIARWERTRRPPVITQVGVDEKFLGRRNKLDEKFVTIVSDLSTGEPVWIGMGRRKETLAAWLGYLTDVQKKSIDVFTMDMHAPFYEAVDDTPGLEHVAISHDPFHIMKRVGEAIDDVRRAVFFRAGPEMRALGRGKRWLLLRAWERNTPAQQAELRLALSHNGKLARAYQLKEEIRALVREAPNGDAMLRGLEHIWRRTRRSSLAPIRRLGESLEAHVDGIVALAEHRPPAGRVEALNNNWEALVRRARGYRDHNYLLRKLRFMVANPLRTRASRDVFADLDQLTQVAA